MWSITLTNPTVKGFWYLHLKSWITLNWTKLGLWSLDRLNEWTIAIYTSLTSTIGFKWSIFERSNLGITKVMIILWRTCNCSCTKWEVKKPSFHLPTPPLHLFLWPEYSDQPLSSLRWTFAHIVMISQYQHICMKPIIFPLPRRWH